MGRKKVAKRSDKPRKKPALRKETLKDLAPGRAKDAKGGATGRPSSPVSLYLCCP